MLQAGDGDEAQDDHKAVTPADAFYPLTMPITVGPGSIAVAITLGSQRPRVSSLPHMTLLGAAAVAGLLAIAATIYVCYRFAEGTVGALGVNGPVTADSAAAAKSFSFSSEASATPPIPHAALLKKCRRVIACKACRFNGWYWQFIRL